MDISPLCLVKNIFLKGTKILCTKDRTTIRTYRYTTRFVPCCSYSRFGTCDLRAMKHVAATATITSACTFVVTH